MTKPSYPPYLSITNLSHRMQRGTQEASFCMDVGQVRTGEDKADTYVKMLQEIMRVTFPVALGIANEYPDVTSLMRAFRDGGPLILEDIRVCIGPFLRVLWIPRDMLSEAKFPETRQQAWRYVRCKDRAGVEQEAVQSFYGKESSDDGSVNTFKAPKWGLTRKSFGYRHSSSSSRYSA